MADGIGNSLGMNYVGVYQVLGKFQWPRFPHIYEENLADKEIVQKYSYSFLYQILHNV